MQNLVEALSYRDIERVFDHIHACIVILGRDGSLLTWNSNFEQSKTDFPSAEHLKDVFPPKDREFVALKLSARLQDRWIGEFPVQAGAPAALCDCLLLPLEDERMIFIAERIESESALQEVIDKLTRRMNLFQVESEVSKKLAKNKQIEMEAVLAQAQEVAHVDPLTFLPNRRTIVKDLQNEVMRAERYHSLFSISVLDLDNFKSINDTYGHPVGDEVLRQVALMLRDSVRHPDVVGRYGGEEFLILLPNSNATSAAEQASRLCRQIRADVLQVREHPIPVTFSIGIAQFKIGEDSWHSLLKRADNAMYMAKNSGRDRWVVAE
jgi:diguanylate cyclase (GGDEF)-like protein